MDLQRIINSIEIRPVTAKEAKERFQEQSKLGPEQITKVIKHYLETSPVFKEGADYNYPVDKLRSFNTVREAETLNQERLLDALTKPGALRKGKNLLSSISSLYDERYSLNDIKNGEIFALDDYFDYDIKNNPAANHHPDYITDMEFAGTIGSAKVRSKSNLKFLKMGNKLLPYGDVNHFLNDRYDFKNNNWGFAKSGTKLEEAGLARPYNIKASWRMQPMGIINIDDAGKVGKNELDWNLLK